MLLPVLVDIVASYAAINRVDSLENASQGSSIWHDTRVWKDPDAVDACIAQLEQKCDDISKSHFNKNPNPSALAWLADRPDMIVYHSLCANINSTLFDSLSYVERPRFPNEITVNEMRAYGWLQLRRQPYDPLSPYVWRHEVNELYRLVPELSAEVRREIDAALS